MIHERRFPRPSDTHYGDHNIFGSTMIYQKILASSTAVTYVIWGISGISEAFPLRPLAEEVEEYRVAIDNAPWSE